MTRCGPGPAEILKGDRTPQAVLEGVSFAARMSVSPDRRFIDVKFAETAEVPEIRKVKAYTSDQKLVDADVPHIRETTLTRRLELEYTGNGSNQPE